MLEFYGTRVTHRGKWRIHEFLRSLLHADYNGDLQVERQGLLWTLNPADFVQTHLYWTNEYEAWDLFHLYRWVQPGSVVFDVGANFGYYSLKLASALKGEGQVFAFEPCAAIFARLQNNVKLNCLESLVGTQCLGLSDTVGFAHLEQCAANSGAATLSLENKGEQILLDTLDHFCEVRKVSKLNLLKIDVEGNELQVLRGGAEVITCRKPTIMIEFNTSALNRFGATVEELAHQLLTWEYDLFTAQREKLLPFQLRRSVPIMCNVFCIPKSK
jgi:FkbM family methyltransferase